MTKQARFNPRVFSLVYPIRYLAMYGRGCYRVDRASKLQGQYVAKGKKRGKIAKMTNASISRLIVTIQATEVEFSSMLTLTYPRRYPLTGTVVKNDLAYITKWLSTKYTTPYLWFLEFQKRGAPHAHIMLDVDDISPRARLQLALKWTSRIVLSEWFEACYGEEINPDQFVAIEAYKILAVAANPKSWERIRDIGGAKKYVTKYAAKAYQKTVPKAFQDVGRFWACSRDVIPKVKHYIDVSDEEVRQFLLERGHPASDYEVLPKYLFNVQAAKPSSGS